MQSLAVALSLVAAVGAAPTELQPTQTNRQGERLTDPRGTPSLATMQRLATAWAGDSTIVRLRPGAEPPTTSHCSSFQTWRDRAYRPERAFDGDHRTAWVENARGHGLGEWISTTIGLDATETPAAIVVIPGFAKNAAMFKRNSRPHRLLAELRCEDSTPTHVFLDLRDARQPQLFVLPQATTQRRGDTCSLRLEIVSIYPGTHYRDTSVAEVQLVTLAAPVDGWAAVAADNFVDLRGVDYQRFADKVTDAPVPKTATDIHVTSGRAIDGHVELIRFVAEKEAALGACGNLCDSANRVTTLPPLWPTRDEIQAPDWFVMQPSGEGVDTWLTITAVPYISTDSQGKPVPCGYQRASGALFSHHRNSNTYFSLDFSLQWYRTGCGG